MYYLKYRPKTVAELDNSFVKPKIQNILKSSSLPHALLFIGSKGMGKTSTARIFAKSLNCLNTLFAKDNGVIEPCNKCQNCISIDTGNSPDVVEQDAASNRGIDEIREIIRNAGFAPMTGKYRVHIIDEAHMITNDAFNALLKTLEEPPSTAVFILATTNEEKLPKTIVSRCVRVPFGTAKKEDIVQMIDRIVKAENLTVSNELKDIIFNYCEGSFRDACKILEDLAIQSKLSPHEAKAYLGVRSWGNLIEMLDQKNLSTTMKWIVEFDEQDGDTAKLIEETLLILQSELIARSTGEEPIYKNLTLNKISLLIRLLHEAHNTMKISPIDTLPLEIAIVEFYNDN